jgi:uncharacterized protein YdaU (DUF1376 family)
MKWYKHDPDAFNSGVAGLTLEEIGAYILIINAIYARDGKLANDERLLQSILRCEIRVLRRLLLSLKGKGKIWDVSGTLAASRTEVELKLAESFSEVQRIRAEKRWKINSNADAKAGDANTTTTTIVEEFKKENSSTGTVGTKVRATDEGFEAFWQAYPKRDGSNPRMPAHKAWLVAVKSGTDPQTIIAAAKAYATDPSTKVGTPYVAQAVTWLHQQRWQDYAEKAAEYARLEAQRAAHEAEQERAKIYWLNQINAKQDAAS